MRKFCSTENNLLCVIVVIENEHHFSVTVSLAGPGPGAILAGGLFAVSRLSWQWSVVAEVFSLNNLFVSLILLLIASFHRAKNAGQRRKVSPDISSSAVCFL